MISKSFKLNIIFRLMTLRLVLSRLYKFPAHKWKLRSMLNEIYDAMQFLRIIKRIAIRKSVALSRHLFAHRINYLPAECINSLALVRNSTMLTGIIRARYSLTCRHFIAVVTCF